MLTLGAWSPVFGADDRLEGERLYGEYCSVCHGEKGDGNTHVRQGLKPAPRDFTDPAAAAGMTPERMLEAVRAGRPGTAMTAWTSQLDERQIGAVVEYIRTAFMAPRDPGQLDHGREIYGSTCAVCHGEDGFGALWGRESLKPPPLNFSDAAIRETMTRDRMINSVTHGRPGTAMVAFSSQLNPADIDAVVDYIIAAFIEGSRPPPLAPVKQAESAHHGAPHGGLSGAAAAGSALPANLSGNVESGRGLYVQNCTACHGADGDGAGPRAYFIFPKPRNFRDPLMKVRFDRAKLFNAIKAGVAGREMPAWGKVLSDQQIADVTEFVMQAFFQADRSGGTEVRAPH